MVIRDLVILDPFSNLIKKESHDKSRDFLSRHCPCPGDCPALVYIRFMYIPKKSLPLLHFGWVLDRNNRIL